FVEKVAEWKIGENETCRDPFFGRGRADAGQFVSRPKGRRLRQQLLQIGEFVSHTANRVRHPHKRRRIGLRPLNYALFVEVRSSGQMGAKISPWPGCVWVKAQFDRRAWHNRGILR